MPQRILPILSLPGIKRDGTRFDGDYYIDAQWCRWQRRLPRKIGGYRAINKYLRGVARTLAGYTRDTYTYVHAGSAAYLEQFTVDGNGNTSIISDRTPAALSTSDLNMWQFDNIADGTSGTNILVAQVAPNLECLCSSSPGQLFTGDLFSTAPLTEVTTVPANWDPSGGVAALFPYTFAFGNNGYVAWSKPGDPTDFLASGAGNAYVTGQKIVRAMPLRGGPGNSPSGLVWSADSLLRVSYIGGTTVFQFDTISAQSSILGAQTVIEYDGIFYWIGTDRFLSFNGVVREVPNELNFNWFFDNLNPSQRQKVFAMKVPRFGEIWWCFPFGDATECTHAVIYNVRENTWYDTVLPNGGRAAGLSPAIFRRPMMSGVDPQPATATEADVAVGGTGYTVGDVIYAVGGIGTIPVEMTITTAPAGVITAVNITNAGSYTETPTNPVATIGGTGTGATFDLTFAGPYQFWIHEAGVNQIVGQNEQPVLSYFETGDISLPVLEGMAGNNKWLSVGFVEPDFVQSGDLTVRVLGQVNARAPTVESDILTIPEVPGSSYEQVTTFKTQRRQLRFRFDSNCIGGDYQAGRILAHLQDADGGVLG